MLCSIRLLPKSRRPCAGNNATWKFLPGDISITIPDESDEHKYLTVNSPENMLVFFPRDVAGRHPQACNYFDHQLIQGP